MVKSQCSAKTTMYITILQQCQSNKRQLVRCGFTVMMGNCQHLKQDL